MQSKMFATRSYHGSQWQENESAIITEKPVSLSVNGEIWITFMCTPQDLEALAIGFLYNEEIIDRNDEVASLRVCPEGDNIDVWLSRHVEKPEKWIRTSGCSGGETAVRKSPAKNLKTAMNNRFRVSPGRVGNLVHMLGETQKLYKKSGGVHTSAISDGERIIFSAEDIGRHNTLDKLAGMCLLNDIHLDKSIILTTGRLSSEMVQKSSRMGAEVLISRTSPSSLSVQMAEEQGITLIGYARGDHFTLYTHPERVSTTPPNVNDDGEEA